MLSFTRRTASSRVENGNTTTSGANASLEHTWAWTGVSLRTVGGKKLPSAVPPSRTLPPSALASSTHAWVRAAAAASTIGPTSTVGSAGSPSRRARAASRKRSMNSSHTASWTNIRWTLMHTCPL